MKTPIKTIGILGGMGPASTLYYYETLCRLTRKRQGGNASPPILLHAFDFAEMQALQEAGEWDTIGERLSDGAKGLQNAGADFILLATNTMHKVDYWLEGNLKIPFLHIADMTGHRLKAEGQKRPALIGTRYTMQEDFYCARIEKASGLKVLTPDISDQEIIQTAIFGELVKGIITPQTTASFISVAERLKQAGADSLILGCTEIGLVLGAENCPLPPYDTALIHCEEAIDMAMSDWTL